MREEDIQALEAGGLLREKAIAGWSSASRDAWPMEKSLDEIPMFGHFVERGFDTPVFGFLPRLPRLLQVRAHTSQPQ
jgi:hypothetical protein